MFRETNVKWPRSMKEALDHFAKSGNFRQNTDWTTKK